MLFVDFNVEDDDDERGGALDEFDVVEDDEDVGGGRNGVGW